MFDIRPPQLAASSSRDANLDPSRRARRVFQECRCRRPIGTSSLQDGTWVRRSLTSTPTVSATPNLLPSSRATLAAGIVKALFDPKGGH
jgi:hypothetical protein